MTISKSQAQSLKPVKINLISQCFTHGMLHVALSRVGVPNSITVSVKEDKKARNVVYKEVLGLNM